MIAVPPYIGPSESQAAAEAEARPATIARAAAGRTLRPVRPVQVYRDLHDALAWFKAAWQDAMEPVQRLHEGFSSVEPGDHQGGPAWHRRFVRFLVVGAEHYDPVRVAWAHMRYGGTLAERTGAAYLFVVACRDFDLRSAGLEMAGHCVCSRIHLPGCACADPDKGKHQHGACPEPALPLGEEYAAWFAERAIDRLRWRLEHPPAARPVERAEWMDRLGFLTREEAATG